MNRNDIAVNAENLRRELRWLEDIVVARMDLIKDQKSRPFAGAYRRIRSEADQPGHTLVGKGKSALTVVRLQDSEPGIFRTTPEGHLAIPVGESVEILDSRDGRARVGGWGLALSPKGKNAWEVSNDKIHVQGWLSYEQTEGLDGLTTPNGEDEAWSRVYTSGNLFHLKPPQLLEEGSNYARFVYENQLSMADRLLLALAICPHLSPELLDRLLVIKNGPGERHLSEIGGVIGDNFRGFVPTGITWQFLLAGYDIETKLVLHRHLGASNFLLREKIIRFGEGKSFEPILNGPILIDELWLRTLWVGDVQILSTEEEIGYGE